MTSIQKLTDFTAELYSVMESVLNKAETKFHSIAKNNKTLCNLLKKIEKNQTAFFYGLCAYNLYRNPMTFGAGALMGMYASVTKEQESFFPSLQESPIMNLAQPKMLAFVTIAKACLGSSALDITFFRMFAGFIAGNAFYHSRVKTEKDTIAPKINSFAEAVNPYVNKVSNLLTSEVARVVHNEGQEELNGFNGDDMDEGVTLGDGRRKQ